MTESDFNPAYEKETIITFNNAESTASYYTLNANKRKMILKLAQDYPDDVKIVQQSEDMAEVILPKKWIRVSAPRVLSEEEREKLVSRGKRLAELMAQKRKQGAATEDSEQEEDTDADTMDTDMDEDE